MNDFRQRLKEERAQLDERLDKLNDFLAWDKSNSIDDVQRALLKVQASAMATYSQCLKERIDRL